MAVAFFHPIMLTPYCRNDKGEDLFKLPDTDEFEPKDYPEFHILCNIHLGKAFPYETITENARIISNIPKDRLTTITWKEIVELGVDVQEDLYWD